ncbi:deoxycytidylate deaminase [Schizosaccharomyces cryophilus OY26]|uniref:Deoxycytidylate deaminase n=1 Tax=Schizosaccharomyces cryophilus (strain OY26 / ATCC MYA-4695 / CBS 11777 / NBRC 106824 / NRRL Y48691) TaxID=653667 RepID=S9VRB4_SCHCR|nr:deoxycytidylate deaminase [Schizosaccharomyces cryophilus OY26]EPY50488.1 deoxycytidylate deaminase [Schizosaccharomyces cryophilus OY26]
MPLVGLTGPVCSGKDTLVEFLVTELGFKPIERVYKADERTDIVYQIDNKILVGVNALIDYVTQHWRSRFVINGIPSTQLLNGILKRPFFLLVYVDAPVLTRFRRYTSYPHLKNTTLEQFCAIQDEAAFKSDNSVNRQRSLAHVHINNDAFDKPILWDKLRCADVMNNDRFRPSWDSYFMQMAGLAAMRSNCMKRRVGCVLVRDNRIIATGYNGTPRGIKNCNDGGCPRCNSAQSCGTDLHTCLCLHAEENALLEAGRERIGSNGILYCDTCPCLTCSVKIAQVGISEVVYSMSYSMDTHSASILEKGGVRLRQFVPPENNVF